MPSDASFKYDRSLIRWVHLSEIIILMFCSSYLNIALIQSLRVLTAGALDCILKVGLIVTNADDISLNAFSPLSVLPSSLLPAGSPYTYNPALWAKYLSKNSLQAPIGLLCGLFAAISSIQIALFPMSCQIEQDTYGFVLKSKVMCKGMSLLYCVVPVCLALLNSL